MLTLLLAILLATAESLGDPFVAGATSAMPAEESHSSELVPEESVTMPELGDSTLEIPRARDESAPADTGLNATPSSSSADAHMPTRALPFARLYGLRDYLKQGVEESPMRVEESIGAELADDTAELKSGQEVIGVAVMKMDRQGPAATAGLRSHTAAVQDLLVGAGMVGGMFFPPALLVLPMIAQSRIGESHDLIIGVDGQRIRNVFEFQDAMREVRSGDILYLSVVRNGELVQVPVAVQDEPYAAGGVCATC